MAPSLVYHGLIRALLFLALNIMSVQPTLTPGKDQLTPGKSGTFFFLFLDYVCLLCILIIFGVRTLIFFPLCCFVLFCFFVFVLFFLLCFCCCCFFMFFCFQFWIFGFSFCPLRRFPSVLHLFLPIAVASYKQCQHFGRLH